MARPADLARSLDRSHPSARDAQLGTLLMEVIAAFNDLRAQHVALLAKLDTANLAGMGNNNVASLSPTVAALLALGARPIKY